MPQWLRQGAHYNGEKNKSQRFFQKSASCIAILNKGLEKFRPAPNSGPVVNNTMETT